MNYNEIYTEQYLEDLIKATYEIAPAVYFKYTWKSQWGITLDDYKQEAAIEICRLFNNRFITKPLEEYTNTNLKTYVYSILDKFFTINLINTRSRETYDKVVHFENITKNPDDSIDKALTILSPYATESYSKETPEKLANLDIGRGELEKLIDNFSITKIPTRKHKYKTDDGTELSEYNIVKYIITGLSRKEVAERYAGVDLTNSELSVISRMYTRVKDGLVSEIKSLSKPAQENILRYLKTL